MRTVLNAVVGEFPADLDPTPEQFVYFMRVTDEKVPIFSSSAEADSQLPAYFEVGVFAGHSLEMLELLLTQVTAVHWLELVQNTIPAPLFGVSRTLVP